MCLFDRCSSRRSSSGLTEIFGALVSAASILLVAFVTTRGSEAVAAPQSTGDAPPAAGATNEKPAEAKAEIDAKSQEVLDRAAKVTLGRYAADRSLKAVRTTGRMVMAGQGISAEVTVLVDGKGRQAMSMNIPGIGTMRSGITNDFGWSFSEMTGPVVMSEAETTQARRQSDLYAVLNWGQRATSITYVGESEIELPDGTKRPTHELRMVSRDTGKPETHHFDREHGWQLRSELMQMIPGAGEIPLTTLYTDYRDVKGMKVPFRTLVTVGPQTQEIVVETVTVNPEVPEDAFAAPEEVRQMADR